MTLVKWAAKSYARARRLMPRSSTGRYLDPFDLSALEFPGSTRAPDPAVPDPVRYRVALQNTETLGPVFGNERIVFHGVNKSGSLAMASVLREAYFHAGRANRFVSHYHKFPLEYETVLSTIENTRDGHCFFVGHYLFDVVKNNDPRLWITQLRHPLPRVVSCYQWQKNKHNKRTGSFEGFPSLSQYVTEGKGKRDSQVWQFAPGGKGGLEAKSLSTKAVFERAVEALDTRIRWFGIAEHFEESIFSLAHLCGLDSVVAWKKDNRNIDRQPISNLPPFEVELIRDVYRYDFEFYEYAKALFLQRIAKVNFGDDFQAYQSRCATEYKDRIL